MSFINVFKTRTTFFLIIIIAIALFLRLLGLGWGLQDNNIVRWSTHYDENFSVVSSQQIDFSKGDINPEIGQIDGSFSYYLWTFNAFILKTIGVLDKTPNHIDTIGQEYADYIFYSRLLIVFFDILSVLLVFFIVRKITGSRSASLMAAFIFAIIPFEIMHSNYMRPHILLNTFLLLIIYLSLFIYDNKKNSLYIKIGIVLGLFVATRFTSLIYALIPIFFFYYANFSALKQRSLKNIAAILFNRKLFIMSGFLLIGLIIGNPSWVLDFNSIKTAIILQENSGKNLGGSIDHLIYIAKYFFFQYTFWIIPAGTFTLWLLFYPACIYSLFIKKYYKYIIPLYLFSIIYFPPIILVYPIETIRTVLPLFPIFTIILGIVISHFNEKFAVKKAVFYVVTGITGFALISTSLFSFSVAKAMGNKSKDAYMQTVSFFENEPPKNKINVAVLAPECGIFIFPNIYNTMNSIPGKNFSFYNGRHKKITNYDNGYDDSIDYYSIKNDSIDYVLICNIDYYGIEPTQEIIEALTKNHDFIVEKEFKNDICFFNLFYDYSHAPHDFRYPFQTIHLLKANNQQE